GEADDDLVRRELLAEADELAPAIADHATTAPVPGELGRGRRRKQAEGEHGSCCEGPNSRPCYPDQWHRESPLLIRANTVSRAAAVGQKPQAGAQPCEKL